MLSPAQVRVEACSRCQLKCPACPTTRGENLAAIGRGALAAADFRRLLEANPGIRRVELGNYGEVFLNPELPDILACAWEHGVATVIDEGANLNHAPDASLEALVQFGTERLRCSIDGVSQATYERYRVGGRLDRVVANIRRINAFKERHGRANPELVLQFIVFGHNEHELERAGVMARLLGMRLELVLNFAPEFMAVRDRERVRRVLGYADRNEFIRSTGRHPGRHQCHGMWVNPQINWNGAMLGCDRNIWGVYPGNAFTGGLEEAMNSEALDHARAMLMGRAAPREGIPCLNCGIYRTMRDREDWITEAELQESAAAGGRRPERLGLPPADLGPLP